MFPRAGLACKPTWSYQANSTNGQFPFLITAISRTWTFSLSRQHAPLASPTPESPDNALGTLTSLVSNCSRPFEPGAIEVLEREYSDFLAFPTNSNVLLLGSRPSPWRRRPPERAALPMALCRIGRIVGSRDSIHRVNRQGSEGDTVQPRLYVGPGNVPSYQSVRTSLW